MSNELLVDDVDERNVGAWFLGDSRSLSNEFDPFCPPSYDLDLKGDGVLRLEADDGGGCETAISGSVSDVRWAVMMKYKSEILY